MAVTSEYVQMECVIPSCKNTFEGRKDAAIKKGWRGIIKLIPSTSLRKDEEQPWRTFLGWCKCHAEQFAVEEIEAPPKKEKKGGI